MKPVKPLSPQQALVKLETLCAAAERCRSELLTKLRRWGIGAEDARRLLLSLEQRGFLDESRFARAFTADKWRFARWGRAKIRLALQAKKISRSDIESAMQQIDPEGYADNLRALLRRRIAHEGPEARTYEGRTRIFRHAASRGYEPALIVQLIKDPALWEPQPS